MAFIDRRVTHSRRAMTPRGGSARALRISSMYMQRTSANSFIATPRAKPSSQKPNLLRPARHCFRRAPTSSLPRTSSRGAMCKEVADRLKRWFLPQHFAAVMWIICQVRQGVVDEIIAMQARPSIRLTLVPHSPSSDLGGPPWYSMRRLEPAVFSPMRGWQTLTRAFLPRLSPNPSPSIPIPRTPLLANRAQPISHTRRPPTSRPRPVALLASAHPHPTSPPRTHRRASSAT